MMQTTQLRRRRRTNRLDNYEKGLRFEKFVIELFNERFFKKKIWRESRNHDGSPVPYDYWNPDIEMELEVFGRKKYRFAVECKWRREFRKGQLSWATSAQICNYQIFQDQVRIPVFIAIGIGGEPDNPEKLYLTPLNSILKSSVHETELIPFERKPTRRFFYDYQQLKLF